MMYKPRQQSSPIEIISSTGRESVPSPSLFESIKTQVLLGVEQFAAHMFSAIDDLFYDLSKRASSSHEANLYFEAMRDIRMGREAVVQCFLFRIGKRFSQLLDLNQFGGNYKPDEAAVALAIVEGDDLEVDLSRTTMISRMRSLYREELRELCLRFDQILVRVTIAEDNNPIDPQQIANAFVEACQSQLLVNIKAKLIVLKMFEKHLLSQLGPVYHAANQALLDAGILPDVPPTKAQDVASPHRRREPEPPANHAAPLAAMPDGFSMNPAALSLLLAAARNASAGYSPYGQSSTIKSPSATINCYIYTTNPGPILRNAELSILLSQAQQKVEQLLAADQPRNLIGEIVSDILAEQDVTQPQALQQEDEDVINLVALFFDEVLSDDNLPIAVQSLVCRLQIPLLKVAMRDNRFFSDADHPARRLINCITTNGLELDESKPLDKDPIYQKMLELVQHINHHYHADSSIFAEAQQSLQTLLDKEKRKSGMVEQRTQQTEEGRHRLAQARLDAQTLIYQKIKDLALPDDVGNFLTGHWLQALVFIHLRHGTESMQWLDAEQTIVDLIWLCHEHADTRSQSRSERILPLLLDNLDTGLTNIISDADHRHEVVRQLEASLQAIGKNPQPVETFRPLTAAQREELGRGAGSAKAWDEMTPIERHMARHEELFNQYYVAAKDMPVGTWVEYSDEVAGKRLRAKLSSKMDDETYLFVNRMGAKLMEKTRKQLALDIQNKRLRVLDARPLFDRIMTRLTGRLRETA